MLRDQPFINALLINILLGALWHYLTFIICITVDTSFFDAGKKMYLPRKWERNGKFYSDVLRINKWKDFLPQHIGKDGFSKDHLDDTSVPYLDEFIMETCRAEWNHSANCLYAVVLFIINNFLMALSLTMLLLLVNLPFALIQRYNRFRLQRFRAAMIKKAERAARRAEKRITEQSETDNDL